MAAHQVDATLFHPGMSPCRAARPFHLKTPLQGVASAAKFSSPPVWITCRGSRGTAVASRPPHRSRRALLTHRAPPSGRTSVANGLSPFAVRRTAANRIDVATRLNVRTTAAVGFSPCVRPFPPRPPQEVAFLCSVASSVLRPHPTSHPRTCSACGYCLPEPARHKSGHG